MDMLRRSGEPRIRLVPDARLAWIKHLGRAIAGLAILVFGVLGTRAATSEPTASSIRIDEPLYFSHGRFVVAVAVGEQVRELSSGRADFKPVSNPRGDKLVFFRVDTFGDGKFETWRTAIVVVNADGTDERRLTSGRFSDYNPTFMRDGSDRIVFNRYNRSGRGHSEIFMTTPQSHPGDEIRISHPTIRAYEWVYSTLRDGRLFVHRIESEDREAYLLTPNPGGTGKYERLRMPTNSYFHKLSVSPSETKVAYMIDNDQDGSTYEDAQIAWAEFDVDQLRVENEQRITPFSPETIEEYPKWSRDESLILYDSNRGGRDVYQVYAYRIADGVEANISPNHRESFQFPTLGGLPK